MPKKTPPSNTFTNEIFAYTIENALAHGEAKESAVLPKLFQHGLEKHQIKAIIPEIKKIVNGINALTPENQQEHFHKYRKFLKEKEKRQEGLKELPNIKGKPVFRLAPFPSGTLHLGNARTYLLNAMYAEKYNGKTILVIDDTIGSEEKAIMPEAYKLIPEAFDWLGIKYQKPIIRKSDRLKIYYKYAKQLIEKNKAYVCHCSQEQLRENRIKQRTCGCRLFPVKKQLKRWKQMFKLKQGEAVLRIKTSMQNPNPAFRDRVLFRISNREHPRTKNKYTVWPLLEFSWAIDDHLLKVTHIIRGKELMIEGEMQKYIWDIFKWKHPELIYMGLIKLEGIGGKLSKSKAQKQVKSGEYSGWDDPRTWSVQSLKRRGIQPESIRKFIENMGLTLKEITVPIDDLYAINRREIDKLAYRYSFVENPVEIKIKNKPRIKPFKVKLHPEYDNYKVMNLGKNMFVSLDDFNKFKNKEVRLMHLFNINLNEQSEYSSNKNNQTIPKINWVSKNVKARILMPDGSYNFGLADQHIKELKKEELIQFERFGFCKYDHYDSKEKEYEFWFAHD